MEGRFAEEFRGLVNASGKSLYQLERATGLDKSYISKIQRGERLPVSEVTVTALLSALSCSTQKSQHLLWLYRLEQLGRAHGEDCEEGIRAVQRLLCVRLPVGERLYEKGNGEVFGGVIHGVEPVIALLYQMLRMEETQTVYIWGAEQYDYLMDALASYRAKQPLKLRHLVCLSADSSRAVENCECLRRMITVMASQEGYEPLISETPVTDPQKNMAGFTALVAAGNQVLCFTDETCAFCMKKPEQVSFWRSRFEVSCLKARVLIVSPQAGMPKGSPQAGECEENKQLHILGEAAFTDPLADRESVRIGFSLNALQSYLHSGMCGESSFFLQERHSVEKRRQRLNLLRKKKEKDSAALQLLQAERMPIAPWLHLRCDRNHCILGIKRKNGSVVWLQITQEPVQELFTLFLSMLEQKLYCYSDGMQTTLLDRLSELLEKYE